MNTEFNAPRGLEAELRNALRREQPSAGFTGRVMARLEQRRHRTVVRSWMAIAAMLVGGVFITAEFRQQEQRHQQMAAQQAAHDLTVALRITGKKLQATRMQVRRRSNGA